MFEAWLTLDIFRFVFFFFMLGYAAWQDHKFGEVKNSTWLYAPFGLVLLLVEYISASPNLLIYSLLSGGITVAVALVLNKFLSHGWGGADTKALLASVICIPLGPATSYFLPLFPLLVLWVGVATALSAMLFKKRKESKFIPHLLLAYILWVVVFNLFSF